VTHVFVRLVTVFFCVSVFGTLAAYGFDLVLDPGHSPKSPGAISCAGVTEYRYNNALVAHIAASLANLPGVRVFLTKKDDEEISLKERVKDTAGKDLFISVHHDSVQPQFLNIKGGNAGNCSDKASGFSIFVSRKNPFFKESLAAATMLGRSLLAQGLRPTLHHAEPIAGENRPLLDKELGIYAYDDLVVLREAHSPAILFEAGVIINPIDEKYIQSDVFKGKVAKAIRTVVQQTKGTHRVGCNPGSARKRKGK